MRRTTLLLNDDVLLEVRRLAQTRGTTLTDVVDRALRAYIDAQPATGLPSFTAAGRSKGSSGRGLGRNAKKVARRAVDPYEGSPREGRR